MKQGLLNSRGDQNRGQNGTAMFTSEGKPFMEMAEG